MAQDNVEELFIMMATESPRLISTGMFRTENTFLRIGRPSSAYVEYTLTSNLKDLVRVEEDSHLHVEENLHHFEIRVVAARNYCIETG